MTYKERLELKNIRDAFKDLGDLAQEYILRLDKLLAVELEPEFTHEPGHIVDVWPAPQASEKKRPFKPRGKMIPKDVPGSMLPRKRPVGSKRNSYNINRQIHSEEVRDELLTALKEHKGQELTTRDLAEMNLPKLLKRYPLGFVQQQAAVNNLLKSCSKVERKYHQRGIVTYMLK